jgi:hypothetical protein
MCVGVLSVLEKMYEKVDITLLNRCELLMLRGFVGGC